MTSPTNSVDNAVDVMPPVQPSSSSSGKQINGESHLKGPWKTIIDNMKSPESCTSEFMEIFNEIMKSDDNLIVEICQNYKIPYQTDNTDIKEALRLQTTIVYLLIGHYYKIPKDITETLEPRHVLILSLFPPKKDAQKSGETKPKEPDVKEEIVEQIWEQVWEKMEDKDKIPAALLAAALFKEMSLKSFDERKELREYSQTISEKAIRKLKKDYQTNEKETRRDLKKTCEAWGNTSTLKLAVHSKNLHFLEHPACKTLLQEEWNGRLSSIMSVKWMMCCLLFIVAGPILLATYKQPSKDKTSNEEWRKDLKWYKKLYYFFEAPVIRFLLHGITYAGFLGYFSYVLLIQFSSETTNDDIILLSFVTAIFIEEFTQCGNGSSQHYLSVLSMLGCEKGKRIYLLTGIARIGIYFTATKECSSSLDILTNNVFIDECCDLSGSVGETKYSITVTKELFGHVMLRKMTTTLFTSRGIWVIINCVSTVLFILGYVLKFHGSLDAARVILGFDLILLYLRSLQIFLIHEQLGPKILTIIHMFKDLAYFIMILLVFVVSYGIAAHSIMYPNSELNVDFTLNLLKRAYWNLYGELLIEELEQKEPSCTFDENLYSSDTLPRCPTASATVWIPIMMGFYILVSNILLLNLLIAMFTSTYEKINLDSGRLWNYQRFFLIKQYKTRYWTPFFWLYILHRLVFKPCCQAKPKENKVNDDQSSTGNGNNAGSST